MKKNKEKVSIIVPCYNGEKFVDRCMASIISQNYTCVECIVVDDGSTDSSSKKIKEWDKKFEEKGWELIYFYQENQGLGAAINAGLKLVTGKYIILLDVDDEYLPGALAEKVDYLIQNQNVYVVRSNGWIINNEQKFLFVNEEEEKKIEDVFTALISGKTNNWAGSYMLRADKLFEFYPNREIYKSRYGQNLQLLLPLVYKQKCGFIDKPHMNYIRQENSLSRASSEREAEKKELQNIGGYTDIRRHMVKQIITEEMELEKVLKLVEYTQYKTTMLVALSYKNESLMECAYGKLKDLNMITLDDRIVYARLNKPRLVLFLRIFRKLIRFFK